MLSGDQRASAASPLRAAGAGRVHACKARTPQAVPALRSYCDEALDGGHIDPCLLVRGCFASPPQTVMSNALLMLNATIPDIDAIEARPPPRRREMK